MFKRLVPNLMVPDVNRAIDFYENTLGFEMVLSVPTEDGTPHWALVRMDEVEIMFQSTISISQQVPVVTAAAIGGSLILYIEASDVQRWYEKLRTRVEIVQELHETFYGTREFAFRDSNGYILAFAERLGPVE